MSLEQQIRDALVQLATSLQGEITHRAATVAAEIAKAATEEQLAAEAETLSRHAAEIAAVRAEADRRLETDVARARAEAEEAAAAELSTLRADLQRARDEVEAVRADLQHARDEAEARRADLQHARDQTEALRSGAERTRGQLEMTVAELALARDRATSAEESLEGERQSWVTARAEERQVELADYDRLIAAVRRIGQAGSLSDVLTDLAEAAAKETSRAAVLVASGDGFRVFQLHGFDPVEPGFISKSEAANLASGLPFASLPADRAGFSIPIEVGGQPVAIVYADDAAPGPSARPSAWPEAIEILARHAALRLETLTALRTVQALSARQGATVVATTGVVSTAVSAVGSTTEDDQSARRYARLLVSEIKLYNETAVRLGRQRRDLFERLRPEIERARRLYEERVPAHVPARATYFDDELVQTLADGDPALLGARS